MKDNKRLFIFAAYDAHGLIDATLLHYLSCLSGVGDIVLTFDSDIQDTEIDKLKSVKNIKTIINGRHGEYDFGSYKRGFGYAKNNKLLDNYDWVYFVNDSVFGALWDIKIMLADLESRNVDLTGVFEFANTEIPAHVQSWFVGMAKALVNENFVAEFFNSVAHQDDKQLIILKYEVRLTQLVLQHGYKMSTLVSGQNDMYNNPLGILKYGAPFIKKAALEKLEGSRFLYPFTDEKFVDDIAKYAIRNGLVLVNSFCKIQKPKYEKLFRFSFFGIPIVAMYKQNASEYTTNYKVCLFDKLPIFKVALNNE